MPRLANGYISVSTLGDHLDAGNDITVYCDADLPSGQRCGRHSNLNLQALADKLGRDHSALAPELSKRLRCKGCGSRRMTFLVQTHAGWNGDGGHSNH